MGALGGIIDKAITSATNANGGTTLQDFLANFSSSDGIWAKTIDPFTSFDVSMKLYPSHSWATAGSDKQDKSWLSNIGNSLMSSAKAAVKSAVNNATGGLIGSIMNSKVSIQKNHDDNPDVKNMDTTFMEYLAAANLIVGKEDWIGEKAGQSVSPLELQLGPYCQEITLPNIEVPQGGTSQTLIGEFPINGTFVKPDTNLIQMKIVNTKVPLHERIFYPWLRETVQPNWSYWQQPYTTATITVDFTKHNDISYVFCGCRPQKIIMQQASQEASSQNLTRDVSFLFDCMFITSSLSNCEDVKSKLLSTGKALVNSASKMLNM